MSVQISKHTFIGTGIDGEVEDIIMDNSGQFHFNVNFAHCLALNAVPAGTPVEITYKINGDEISGYFNISTEPTSSRIEPVSVTFIDTREKIVPKLESKTQLSASITFSYTMYSSTVTTDPTNIKIFVGDDVKPAQPKFDFNILNGYTYASGKTIALQGYTQVELGTFVNCGDVGYGATIQNYTFEGYKIYKNEDIYTVAPNIFDTTIRTNGLRSSLLIQTGEFSYTLAQKDSRGRKRTSKASKIKVYQYTRPKIRSYSASLTDGGIINVKLNTKHQSLNIDSADRNNIIYEITAVYTEEGAKKTKRIKSTEVDNGDFNVNAISDNNEIKDTQYVFTLKQDRTIDIQKLNSSVEVTIKVNDNVGNEALGKGNIVKVTYVSNGNKIFNIAADGTAVCVGGKADSEFSYNENTFQSMWRGLFRKGLLSSDIYMASESEQGEAGWSPFQFTDKISNLAKMPQRKISGSVNDLSDPGIYTVTSDVSNLPEVGYYYTIITFPYAAQGGTSLATDSSMAQLAITSGTGNTNKIYWRHKAKVNDVPTWTGWDSVSNYLPLSGGTVTGPTTFNSQLTLKGGISQPQTGSSGGNVLRNGLDVYGNITMHSGNIIAGANKIIGSEMYLGSDDDFTNKISNLATMPQRKESGSANEFTTPGIYTATQGVTDTPSSGYYTIITFPYTATASGELYLATDSSMAQLAISSGTGTPNGMYWRHCTGLNSTATKHVWTEWNSVSNYLSNYLPLSGGTVTGPTTFKVGITQPQTGSSGKNVLRNGLDMYGDVTVYNGGITSYGDITAGANKIIGSEIYLGSSSSFTNKISRLATMPQRKESGSADDLSAPGIYTVTSGVSDIPSSDYYTIITFPYAASGGTSLATDSSMAQLAITSGNGSTNKAFVRHKAKVNDTATWTDWRELTDGISNFTSDNGYQKLPSGLILQWGKYEIDHTTAKTGGAVSWNTDPIAFNISYPTAAMGLVANNSSRINHEIVGRSLTKSNFTLYIYNTKGSNMTNAKSTAQWFSWGY